MSFPTLSYQQAHESPSLFIEELRSALLTSGFFYLFNIDPIISTFSKSSEDIFKASQDFFESSSNEEKELIGMVHSRHFRGWSCLGSESTQGKRDSREQLDLGPDTDPMISYPPRPSDLIELSLYGPNQYPNAAFEQSLRTYREHCTTIAHHLISLLAQSITTQPELITDLFHPPPLSSNPAADSSTPTMFPAFSRMKIARYPPTGSASYGLHAHKDGGGLTLLAQDDIGGLEVQMWDGEWRGVEPRKGHLVVNVGQVIERLTHSLYPATTHRVLSTISAQSRYSIPFFFSPHLLNSVYPLPLSSLHPLMLALYSSSEEQQKRDARITDVKKGDLHEEKFGMAAWRGVTRSHQAVWEKFYGREMDKIGGPDEGARA